MQLHTVISALAALVTASSAIPTPDAPTEIAAKAPSSNPADHKQYYLKTQLLPGQKNPRFNNLYVQLYYTGAGLDDAVVGKKRIETAYLNGTKNLFNIYEGNQTFYP